MALETLKGVMELGGFKVVDMEALREEYPNRFNAFGVMDYGWYEKSIRPYKFVSIRHDKNSIAFTIQNGPVKEKGVNGCHVDTLIHAAKALLEGFQNKNPCRENACAITKLDEAIHWLDHRTKNRVERKVEGTSQP